MRAIGAAVLLAPLIAAPVNAEASLEAQVAATFGPRTTDAGLTAIAADRVAYQIAHANGVCDGDGSITHAGALSWTGEVLACNFDGDPAGAVNQWAASPPHAFVLSQGWLSRIGCAHAQSANGDHWWACVLAEAPAPQPAAPAPTVMPPTPPTPIRTLPDTAVLP